MPVNPHRGEIEATLDGTSYRLCLTLGALAELEHELAASDMVSLAEKIEQGRFTAREIAAIIAAGLRGGGSEHTTEQVMTMQVEGGASGYISIAVQLLEASFGNA